MPRFTMRLFAVVLATLFAVIRLSTAQDVVVNDYGVDCSFPIIRTDLSGCPHVFADNRTRAYEEFMEGCRQHYGNKASRCDSTETDRRAMSLRQPASMVNYTATGYHKLKAPQQVMELLYAHWDRNFVNRKEEAWPVGNVYVNHWASPTSMLSVEDTGLRGGGHTLKQQIWEAAKTTIEAWTNMELKPTSMYGIRVYTEGAVLSPHVDRLPLVSSAIVNVAQDVDEDWILEVIDRLGRAVNVTMEPGDMVLYESGSLIHGRPFPLKGRYFANIFIHFEPTGRILGEDNSDYLERMETLNGLPPYLLPGSPEEANWRAHNPGGWNKPSPSAPIQQIHSPEGHHAAAMGDVEVLAQLAKRNRKALQAKDANGWQPIHEATRSGSRDALALLLAHGADINARTGTRGRGSSVLNLALEYHEANHEIVNYLLTRGAKDIEPEL
jgi:prolyl 4-hydroxylase